MGLFFVPYVFFFIDYQYNKLCQQNNIFTNLSICYIFILNLTSSDSYSNYYLIFLLQKFVMCPHIFLQGYQLIFIMSKIVASSESQSQSIIMRKFALYFKKIAHFYIQVQNYKRQLASFLNSIDYTLPFSCLDLDHKGAISQKNIQLFLIQHKYYVKPIDVDRYFKKYVHGKEYLSYQDILQCLVPHSDYILMASTAKHITQSLMNKQKSMYMCNRVQNKIVKNIVAIILNAQIQYIKSSFHMMDDITNGGLRVGQMLWRVVDRKRDNYLDFYRMHQICWQNSVEITQNQWKAFINWHFRSHKKFLNRDDFMVIFDSLISNKGNGSSCNYEQFVQRQIYKKVSESERIRRSKVKEMAFSRVQKASNQYIKRSMTTQKWKKGQQNEQIIDPSKQICGKRLLYTKIGYKNPSNFIKMSELS